MALWQYLLQNGKHLETDLAKAMELLASQPPQDLLKLQQEFMILKNKEQNNQSKLQSP